MAGIDSGSAARNAFRPPLRARSRNRSGAPLGDAGQVRHRDGEEVQHIPQRCAVEVAVGLDAAVGVITGLSMADASSIDHPLGMINSVAHSAGHLRAQRSE